VRPIPILEVERCPPTEPRPVFLPCASHSPLNIRDKSCTTKRPIVYITRVHRVVDTYERISPSHGSRHGAPLSIAVLSGYIATAPAANTLRVGFFPNMTHAQALFGARDRMYQQALEANSRFNRERTTRVRTQSQPF